MKKSTSYYLGAAALLGGALLLTRKKKQKLFLTSGGKGSIGVGQMMTLRFRRGDYQMLGGDGLTMIAQNHTGDKTDVVVTANDTALPFTVTPTFIDTTDDKNQHTVTLNVVVPE